MASSPGRGVALALVCLAILGAMPVLSSSRPEEFTPLSFAFWLSFWQVISAAPVVVWERRRGGRAVFGAGTERAAQRRAVVIALVTGAMFGASTYLYVLSVEKAGAVTAAIAIQAYPLFAILWETLLLRRRKTPLELAVTGVLIVALYFLGTGGAWRIDGLSLWFLAALSVPFLWSVAHVIIREELARTAITPAQVTLVRVVISTLCLAGVLAVLRPEALWEDFGRLDFQLAALAMGVAYYVELLLWFSAVRHIDVSLASSIVTPWPALTMALAFLVLGDPVEAYQIVAFLIVAASIYALIVLGLRRARAAAQTA